MLFEQTNRAKYRTDFKEFVYESSVEDFCDLSDADIVVSTIHKAKGREFDDVYMLVTRSKDQRDEVLRRYYVGATRAKERLFIHTNDSIFDRMPADKHLVSSQQYTFPDEIVLQLTHKDVNLGFFTNRKNEILALRSGQTLRFDNNYLYDCSTGVAVAQLSKNMRKKLGEWTEKDYSVISATIRFIVAWRPKNAPQNNNEHAVLLADLLLRKQRKIPAE